MGRFLLVCAIVVLAGCAATDSAPSGRQPYYGSPVEVIKAGPDYAVVNFVNPLQPLDVAATAVLFYYWPLSYQIWDRDNLIGFVGPWHRYIQYRASAGEHIFFAGVMRENAGSWTVLKGKLEAGKTYYVKVTQRWNTFLPAVSLEVLKPTDPNTDELMADVKPFAIDRTRSNQAKLWDDYVQANSGKLQKALENLQQGGRNFYFDPDLKPEDGR